MEKRYFGVTSYLFGFLILSPGSLPSAEALWVRIQRTAPGEHGKSRKPVD